MNGNGQACTACQGQGAVASAAGVQKCPLCDGSGQAFDPGLFFMYETGPQVLGALATSQISIQILDRPFRWMEFTGTSTGAFTVILQDSRNKRPFMNGPVHSANIVGTGQNPFPLLTPFVFEKRGSILITITDLSNAQNTVRLNFIGVELSDTSSS